MEDHKYHISNISIHMELKNLLMEGENENGLRLEFSSFLLWVVHWVHNLPAQKHWPVDDGLSIHRPSLHDGLALTSGLNHPNVFSDPSHLLLSTLPGSVVNAGSSLKTKQNKRFLKIVNFRVYLQAHISPVSHCTVWAFETYVPKEHLGCVYFCLNAVFFHKRGRDFDITHKVTRVNSIRQKTFKLFPEKDHTTLPMGKVIRWNRTPKSSCLLD